MTVKRLIPIDIFAKEIYNISYEYFKKHNFNPEYNIITVDLKFYYIDTNDNLIGHFDSENMITVPFWYEFEVGSMEEDHNNNSSFYEFVDVVFDTIELKIWV